MEIEKDHRANTVADWNRIFAINVIATSSASKYGATKGTIHALTHAPQRIRVNAI